MTDINCANLIDLSLEDDIPSINNIQIKTENTSQPSEATNECLLFISPTWRKRDSLDNNPFDCVQKLAHRIDDPFDIVEKEACLKAQQALKSPPEVKMGNLLSLSDDNLLGEKQMPETLNLVTEQRNKFKLQELELESPPVMLQKKPQTESVSGPDTDSSPNSSAETTASAKLKKNTEYRKRLLKLSISNAAFSSPIARKPSVEFEDILGTPVTTMFSRAAEFGEHLLSAESPLKLIDEDEDLISQDPPSSIESDKIFEADLEMLKIPILNELPSPVVEQISINLNPGSPDVVNKTSSLEDALPKLEAIKAKLKAKREEINSNHQQEISSLIYNLKSLISSGATDKCKKQQASELLESLSSALKPAEADETLRQPDNLTVDPHPIKRQGTFDIELQGNGKAELDSQPLVQEMPNCMISSSATYDGETADEKQDLNLPEIAPLSPLTSPTHYHNQHNNNAESQIQYDVNDIMEHLSKLLINNSADKQSNNHNNPTLIVVMNTNSLNHSNVNNNHQNIVDAKQRSALVASYLENSLNDGSPELTKVNPIERRRSQSLSIHDKVKIVQLPLQPSTPRFIQKQQRVQLDDTPPVTTTPPYGDKETPEFKSPARIRRYSYSSGTPYTTQVGVRRTGFGSDNKNFTHIRRTQTLDTHHEGQQQVIVKPMPSNNMPTFKPDLKKKHKHNTESIIKSGPLKATIPVKKVAPMLKTSPPTPDNNSKASTLHNTSLQSTSKMSRVPTTPLTAKAKDSSNLGVGYPNACSTPAAFTSPLKRTTGPVNKPRYYMSTTPNPKSSSATRSAASAGLKRRTITEFKAKSPLKPRVSSLGLASSTSRTSTGSTRLSTSAGARVSKTPIKITTSNTATVKPTSRLGSRISVGGSALSTRNKENKRP